mmetsp:Transcript_57660/g.151744  ORF Transcript_57660/g.151744 Transcript_57660/m.151744 type:complete len:247 (+) Transcript_57660:339-1079(+)
MNTASDLFMMMNGDDDEHKCSMMEFVKRMVKDADEQKPLVGIVAKLVAKLVDANDKLPADREITVFHAQKAPAVNVVDYAERIAKYSSCSSCCFVVGIIYIDRFIEQQKAQNREFRMNSLNVHRLMLSSIMVAAKFLDDFYYSNEFWAKIGGVPNNELNTLELEFLFLTNFDLHVRREVYDMYRERLLEWHQQLVSNSYTGRHTTGVDGARGCLLEAMCRGSSHSDSMGMDLDRDSGKRDEMAVDA